MGVSINDTPMDLGFDGFHRRVSTTRSLDATLAEESRRHEELSVFRFLYKARSAALPNGPVVSRRHGSIISQNGLHDLVVDAATAL